MEPDNDSKYNLETSCIVFLYPCPLHLAPPPPTHPDMSESNNAVDLIGYWCHTSEAKIHGGPTSLIVFHFRKWPFSLPFLLAIWNSIYCICIKYFQSPFRFTINVSFRFSKRNSLKASNIWFSNLIEGLLEIKPRWTFSSLRSGRYRLF